MSNNTVQFAVLLLIASLIVLFVGSPDMHDLLLAKLKGCTP